MRYPIVLFLLCISLSLFAKNKTHYAHTATKSVGVKSIENTILFTQIGSEFNDEHTVLNPNYNPAIKNTMATTYDSFSISDGTISIEEISYKNDLKTASQNQSIDAQTIFRHGMYYGFTLMLILLNLVCFFLFEEKTFLYYSLVLGSSSLLLFFSDGLLSLIDINPLQNLLNTQALLLFFTASFSALFVSKYLLINEYVPKLKYATISVLCIGAIFLISGTVSENIIMLTIANTLFYTVIATYFFTGIVLFGKKNYAKFFVIASFVPLLFSLDFFVLAPLGFNFLETQTSHLKAAMIAEMLIITYAIMYRMQAIKEENALRQAEMRIFLKRQEVLSARQKTEKIVEDVYLENLIMHYDLDGLEIKLLQYISEGKENSKIARKLKTTESEIEDMTKDLYEKLEIGEQIQQDYRMVDEQPDYIYN